MAKPTLAGPVVLVVLMGGPPPEQYPPDATSGEGEYRFRQQRICAIAAYLKELWGKDKIKVISYGPSAKSTYAQDHILGLRIFRYDRILVVTDWEGPFENVAHVVTTGEESQKRCFLAVCDEDLFTTESLEAHDASGLASAYDRLQTLPAGFHKMDAALALVG